MHWLPIGLAMALGVCVLVALELLRRLRRRNARDVEAQVTATVETLEARLDELARELSERRQPRRGGGAAQPLPRPDRHDDRPRRRDRLHAPGRRRAAEGRRGGRRARSGRRRRRAAARLDRARPRARTRRTRHPDLHRARRSGGRRARSSSRTCTRRSRRPERCTGHSVCRSSAAPAGSAGSASSRATPTSRFGDDDVRRLEELAERVAPAIENARRFREARQLADLDSLTGLHNRRYFYETLAREVDRAQRYQRRLALVIVDVDGFKEINDRIGHLAGDAVLAEIADRIRAGRALGRHPLPGRRRRVRGDRPRGRGRPGRASSSGGSSGRSRRSRSRAPAACASRPAWPTSSRTTDPTSLFERGDESLYAAKHAGKGGLAAAD